MNLATESCSIAIGGLGATPYGGRAPRTVHHVPSVSVQGWASAQHSRALKCESVPLVGFDATSSGLCRRRPDALGSLEVRGVAAVGGPGLSLLWTQQSAQPAVRFVATASSSSSMPADAIGDAVHFDGFADAWVRTLTDQPNSVSSSSFQRIYVRGKQWLHNSWR